jgi:hypothetical protein
MCQDSTLKMETALWSKTMLNFYQTLMRSIPEDLILHSHSRIKLLFEPETSQSDRDWYFYSRFTNTPWTIPRPKD